MERFIMTNKLNETTLGSYSFAEGFMLGGTMQKIGEGKKLDWDGVKQFIEENKEDILNVSGGLSEDWSWTADVIWNKEDGFIEDNDVWNSSTWATPAIEVYYKNGTTKVFEMYLEGME